MPFQPVWHKGLRYAEGRGVSLLLAQLLILDFFVLRYPNCSLLLVLLYYPFGWLNQAAAQFLCGRLTRSLLPAIFSIRAKYGTSIHTTGRRSFCLLR